MASVKESEGGEGAVVNVNIIDLIILPKCILRGLFSYTSVGTHSAKCLPMMMCGFWARIRD